MAKTSSTSPSTVRRLTDPDIAPKMDAYRKLLKQNKAEAEKLLKRVGIITKSGKLSKNFGG